MTTTKGFSLIEVLMALLLTTVGVLGMVALQGRSIQSVSYTHLDVYKRQAAPTAQIELKARRDSAPHPAPPCSRHRPR